MRIGLLPPALMLGLFLGPSAQSSANGQVYPPMDPGRAPDLIETAAEQEGLFQRRRMIYHDEELQAVVDRVAADVVPIVHDDYIDFRVHLIREPSPYVFSLADGQIYLHTGLLARLENESQLAAVIAHEAHHIAAHHHITATIERRGTGKFHGWMEIATEGFRGTDLQSDERNAIWHNLRTEFSDQMEAEADAASALLIANSGYSPGAVLQALEHLMKDPELSAARFRLNDFYEEQKQTWNPFVEQTTTHAEKLEARHAVLKANDEMPAVDPSATLEPRPLLLRRIIEMTIDDYIRLNRPGTAVEVIDELIAVQPDAFLLAAKGDSHVALGPRPNNNENVDDTFKFLGLEGTVYINGKRRELTRDEVYEKYMATEEGQARYAQNMKLAFDSYNGALQLDENSGRAHRGLGNLYFDLGDYRQAGRHYLKYLKIEPDALDRTLIVEKLNDIRNELSAQKDS